MDKPCSSLGDYTPCLIVMSTICQPAAHALIFRRHLVRGVPSGALT